jgi:hypothetical protein
MKNTFLTIRKKPLHNKKQIINRNHIHIGLSLFSNPNTLYHSICKHYNISNVSLYNPLYNILASGHNSHSTFNNKYKLCRIYKKTEKIFSHGSVYFCLVKKGNKYLKRKVFIKELPTIQPELFVKYFSYMIQNPPFFPNYFMDQYNKYLYSVDNPTYIDIFCNFLCSKLVEEDISPHFPLFYGAINTVFQKFTYGFSDKSEMLDFKRHHQSEVKFIENDEREKYLMQIKHFPTFLLASERLEFDLLTYLTDDNTKSIDDNDLLAILFQVVCAIHLPHKNWNMYHNDLHTSNVMFVKTNMEYIYYNYRENYYRVPLNNKLVKIIDWDRATLEYAGVKFNNLNYSSDGCCTDMYRFTSKIHRQSPIEPNPSFDLALLAYDIHKESDKLAKGSKIFKLLNEWTNTEDGNNIISMYKGKDSGFDLYRDIASGCKNAIPDKQITKQIFKCFLINKSNIPIGSKIYIL